ncbi:DnaJ domain-containing protein [Candidatus Vidania fulgoroideorum]
MKDYYLILGVNKNSSLEEIKTSYRKLAMKYHPDRNQGDKKSEDKFKEINEAYSILSDNIKREEYDNGFDNRINNNNFDFSSFDIFNDIFNFKKKKKKKIFDLEISLEESQLGVSKTLNIPLDKKCFLCLGKGFDKNKSVKCSNCLGYGYIVQGDSFFKIKQTCFNCEGKGFLIRKFCKQCLGKGIIKLHTKKIIYIKKNVEEGKKIPLNINDFKESVFINIIFKNHPLYKKKRLDIYYNFNINFVDMILGCKKKIKGLRNNDIFFKIPKLSRDNDVILIKNEGLYTEYNKGNMYIILKTILPKNISDKQLKLLKKFKKL